MPPETLDIEKAGAALLAIKDIASWQLPEFDDATCGIVAALPAIQRGAVWKARQIEALWDSLVRGFPIGSFLVTPFDSERNRGETGLLVGENERACYHLLDGQQRANAIALGYFDPWKLNRGSTTPAVLWVDLKAPEQNDDREYLFRLVTRAHPWGYSRDIDGKALTVGQRREAFGAYRNGQNRLEKLKAFELPLTDVWPWDAKAPLPVPLLVSAVLASKGDPDSARSQLRQRLEELPFWATAPAWAHGPAKALEEHLSGHRFMALVARMAKTVCASQKTFGVPVLMLPAALARGDNDEVSQSSPDGRDPVETLFIRINAGGTPLQGEELIYSILKSIWPEAGGAIKRIDCPFISPARLVVLVARLIVAREALRKGSSTTPPVPPVPDVARFRRLMRNAPDGGCEAFEKKLTEFIGRPERGGLAETPDAIERFSLMTDLLIGGKGSAGAVHQFALPSVLAIDMAQRAPDMFFLLLFWIDRVLLEQPDLDLRAKLGTAWHRQLLGMLTALSWFAADQSQCCRTLWEMLVQCEPAKLQSFFSRSRLSRLLSLNKFGALQLLPAVPPDVLQAAIEESITNCCANSVGKFSNPKGPFWNKWEWYSYFAGSAYTPDSILEWYSSALGDHWGRKATEDAEAVDVSVKFSDSWTQFIDRLHGDKRFVLYAQRKWIRRWYEQHDHCIPGQLDDIERPWDFDHIHPGHYVNGRHRIPQIVKDWHNSIGNLRAWPLEANRSAAEAPPCIKLKDVSPFEKLYDIETEKDKLAASAISAADKEHWFCSTPNQDADFDPKYLASGENHGECRKELILAITTRFVEIYRIWYEELHLDRLLPTVK